MATVVFYGDLQKYGKRFTLDVATAGEAMRALFAQIKGLRQHINNGGYFVRVAQKDTDENTIKADFNKPLNDKDVIHVVPEISGAGKFGTIILGAVLIAAAFATGGVTIAGMAISEGTMMMAGIGMLVAGAAQLLMKPPKFETQKAVDAPDSSSFSNLGNQAAEGCCVPVAYGRIRVGAKTISQGIESYNLNGDK